MLPITFCDVTRELILGCVHLFGGGAFALPDPDLQLVFGPPKVLGESLLKSDGVVFSMNQTWGVLGAKGPEEESVNR